LVSTQLQYLGARSTPFGGLAWAPKLIQRKNATELKTFGKS
jgi:hypothetical protein